MILARPLGGCSFLSSVHNNQTSRNFQIHLKFVLGPLGSLVGAYSWGVFLMYQVRTCGFLLKIDGHALIDECLN